MAEILQQDVYDIVGQSFLDYSLSVITDRALPNIIDGLKPVQRKVLYSMWENNLTPSANFHKCATTVGHVIGSYSPHGDTSTYDALVNMSQPFGMRYPLIDFSGNNGSLDGDPPAAYRYTESKLSPIGYAMMENLDKDTVKFVPNFDNTKTEPINMSGYICDILLNGCSGIAVGMACNLVPHNLNEVYDALIYYIDSMLEGKEYIDESEVFDIIKGPDFPLGGTIINKNGIYDYMRTGTGNVTVRADYVEETKDGKTQFVFVNLPYKVNKADLVAHIDELIDNGFLSEAKEVRDESSKGDYVRIVVELKKNVNKDILINKLYRRTKLQSSISINNTVLVDGTPAVVNMDTILSSFLSHSVDVSVNYINYENNKLVARLNIVNGILKAADRIDEVIEIIKNSEKEFEDLKNSGIFDNDEQIQAILDMPLKNISKLNKQKYIDQKEELESKHTEYVKLLTDQNELLKYIKEKYMNVKKKFGDERRTTIQDTNEFLNIEDEDLIMEEQIVLSYSCNDIIKSVSETEYKSQKRNGRGVSQNVNESDGDTIKKIVTMSNKDDIMFFTNTGKCHILKGYEIPKTSKNARGKHINNYLKLEDGEMIVNLITGDTENMDNNLVFVTKNGMIKRMSFELLPKRGAGRVIGLVDDDTLVDVCVASDNSRFIMVTANGMALAVDADKVRPSGRSSRGVKGIKIKPDDAIVKVIAEPIEAHAKHYIFTITKYGYAKRTDTDEFGSKGRGGAGVKAHKVTDTTGKVVAAVIAEDGASIFASTKNGQMIRTPMEGFRSQGRNASGVALMKLEDSDSIASVTVLYTDAVEEESPAAEAVAE